MRLRFGSLFIVAIFAVAGCKPDYPNCESDDHCQEKGEVCLNKQCQECRDDTQCAAKYPDGTHECVTGRCEVKPECRTDADCESVGEGLVCRGDKCVPECADDDDCPSGRKCEGQRCVAECQMDVDCGPGRTCVDGACQDGGRGLNVSSECQPMDASSGDVIALAVVNFEFDQYDLTVNARNNLDQNAECLRQAESVTVVMEGHCDERGTQEYNMALGEKRAATVRTYLRNLGIDVSRMETRSKGENEPVCNSSSESCFAKNRRVEFLQSR